MTLSFDNKFFCLTEVPTKDLAHLLSKGWDLYSENPDEPPQLITEDLQKAAQFRQYSDDSASKFFTRRMIQKFPAPLRSLPSFLDEHQKQGVNWILTRSRSYLNHAPGAGKTCEAIVAAAIANENAKQTLFIVPPTLTTNWVKEIEKFGGGPYFSTVAVVPTTYSKDNMDWTADYIICPDSMLTRDWVQAALKPKVFGLIAVDEAHRFKNPLAARTISLFGGIVSTGRGFSGLIHKTKYIVLLSGTPMPNRPLELWAPLYALAPESIDFRSQMDFGFAYCGPRMNDFGRWEFSGSSNEEDLRCRIHENFMHTVTEDALGLIPRTRSMVFMNTIKRPKTMLEWEQKNLSKIKDLRLSEDDSQGKIALLRKEIGKSKVPWVVKYVRDIMDSGSESILIFAWHREVVMGLAEKLKAPYIIGGMDKHLRDRHIASFQSGKTKILIGNIDSMGEGHNLQTGTRVIFAEYSWTESKNTQCEKRIHRKGQTKKVFCEYIVLPDSLDEVVLNVVFNKAATIKKIVG